MVEVASEGHEPGISIDSLFGIVEKRWRRWLATGIVSFAAVLIACLLFIPQTYTSRLSLSVAQTNEGAGVLSGLGFGSTSTSKFVGVLKSRRFAEEVSQKAGLQSLFGLHTADDATDMLVGSLNVTDNARDGLIYVTVSLPAPPWIKKDGVLRRKIREAGAVATNAYADILRSYVATSDFDRDSVLLNGAQQELQRIRGEYDAAVGRMLDLVRQSKQAGLASLPPQTRAGDSGADVAGATKALQELYTARATLESEIQASEATQRTADRLQADQLKNLSALPSEDPLLTQARASVNTAKLEYDTLSLQFGKEHPKVVIAQDALNLAQAKLAEQTRAVLKGQTTQKVQSRVHLDALRTKYNTIVRQIGAAEGKAQVGRVFQTEFERRRNEVMLRLEVLKAASAQAATLSLQMVSATKRLNVVDTARPAKKASPGLPLLVALSCFLALVFVGSCAAVDYLMALRSFHRSGVVAVQIARAANGTHANGANGNGKQSNGTHANGAQPKEVPVGHGAADGTSQE